MIVAMAIKFKVLMEHADNVQQVDSLIQQEGLAQLELII